MKSLFIFAGANGSGKTTLYNRHKERFSEMGYINADEILKSLTGINDPADAKFGQNLANQKIENYFAEEKSFVFETVFSHESKIELIKRAKLLGYSVSIYFCHTSDSSLNVSRVKRRVGLGGHDVPEDKILNRIPRTLKNIKSAISLVDEFYLFDNSSVDGHILVAHKSPLSNPVININAPSWAKELVQASGQTIKQSLKKMNYKNSLFVTANNIKTRTKHKKCHRCGRYLRGKIRPYYGVCSVCEPKIER